MTDIQLLAEVKTGLGIPSASTAHDGVLTQKLKLVKGFLSSAGISETILATDTAVGALVCGVTDVWSLQGGETKFSPLFYTLAAQLSMASLPAEEST